MNLQTLMQTAPAKANELFGKLLETSDAAVKTREKLFADLKTELELHISLEEQHLFPVLRRNAETKGLVAEAIKDNKELRSKLAEVETLPKNDAAFPSRLRELQKTFRQHARDDKRELLPAVRRALSEVQVQGVAQKMEAGVVEAQQARHDELEERRIKARQEREQAAQLQETERATKAAAERIRREAAEQRQAAVRQEHEQAAKQQEAERAKQAEADRRRQEETERLQEVAKHDREQAAQQLEAARVKKAEAERLRHQEAEQKRVAAQQERQRAEQQAAQQLEAERLKKAEAERARHQAEQKRTTARQEQERAELLAAQQERTRTQAVHQLREAAETAAQAAATAQATVLRIADGAATRPRTGEFRGMADAYRDAVKTILPNRRSVASLPATSVDAMVEIRSVWLDWVSQTTRASQDVMWQAAGQQQRIMSSMVQHWMEQNARVVQLTLRMAQETVRQAAARSTPGEQENRRDL